MVAKALIGVSIIGFCVLCGYLLSKKYRIKRAFFSQLKEFNERFINEISYYRRPIETFIYAYEYKGEFFLLLQDFLKCIKDENVTISQILTLPEYTFLKKEDKKRVEDYFSMLGKGDSASQKAYFSSIKDELAKEAEGASADAKKYVDLYIKLGFLFGIFLFILIL